MELNNTSGFDFKMPKGNSSIIKVIGVGGGGNNALKHMYERGIYGVDFVICNTDSQTLDSNPISNKVQLGASITEGLGAGADPEVGEKAAIESIEDIKAVLGSNTKMVFITAGMGGGTGTGAAPVVAKIAKDLGILTVAIVTVPFDFEGKRRLEQAEDGLEKLKENVDSLIVINNNKVAEQFPDLDYEEAFFKADEVLTNAAKGMSEVITAPFKVNIDFRDAKSVLENSGTALMSIGIATGENRAEEAVRKALDSPLLNNSKIRGAKNVLLLILSGQDDGFKAKMSEIALISKYIQREAGGENEANVILGIGKDEELGEAIKVLVIATGFAPEYHKKDEAKESVPKADRVTISLDGEITSKPEVVPAITPASVETSAQQPTDFQKTEIESSKKVFRLEDTDEAQPNLPTNSLSLAQENELEVQVLEQEPQFEIQEKEQIEFSFEEEPIKEEQPKVEYDLFSYHDLETVSYEFDLDEEKKESKPEISFQIEEQPESFDFKINQEEIKPSFIAKIEEEQEETMFKVVEKEEEIIEEAPSFLQESIVEQKIEESPVYEVEQKEEFTIIEKKSIEENPKVLERRNKLKEFNSRYQTNEEENPFESIPAFKRRNVTLDFENASEQNITSFYSEENGNVKMRENRFLNKDVD